MQQNSGYFTMTEKNQKFSTDGECWKFLIFKYKWVASVDAERSFSGYKQVLGEILNRI